MDRTEKRIYTWTLTILAILAAFLAGRYLSVDQMRYQKRVINQLQQENYGLRYQLEVERLLRDPDAV